MDEASLGIIDPEYLAGLMEKTASDPTGYENMVAGRPYEVPDGYILAREAESTAKLAEYLALPEMDMTARNAFLRDYLQTSGRIQVKPPVYWEYGHIELGDGVFLNKGCEFYDNAWVRIGACAAIAPGVKFLTAGHPIRAEDRIHTNPETGALQKVTVTCKPISVGAFCWIGAGALILGGVTIGEGTMVGAGAVVTKSLPARVFAAGTPARVIRNL